MARIYSILKVVLEKINPNQEELNLIYSSLEDFKKKLLEKLERLQIDAEIFVGGSFAKGTVIRKDKYDVDIFLRFNPKYNDAEISEITLNLLNDFPNVSVIHGSRDYFRIKLGLNSFLEIIPVIKIKNPKELQNITDLSYSHVKYIKKKIKIQKTLDEIKIAKAFCYANHCYGAESYINGFSGYALELMIYYYGSFLNFVNAIVKLKEKEVIDIEKHFKNKKEVLMDLSGSKLGSPIILIDPTYKQRNALAALSEETFKKFQKDCQTFLKNPEINNFEIKKTDLEEIKKTALKNKNEFILFEASTDKQEGDIAGSKLFKFYKHLDYEIKKYFLVKNKGFNYNGLGSARYFFVVKDKKEILIKGPLIKDEKNVKAFEKIHKDYFTRKGRLYSKEKIDFKLREFIEKWKIKNKQKIKEMYLERIDVVD